MSSKDKLDFFQDRKNYQQLLGNDLFDEALLYIADQPIKNDNQSIAKKFIEWYDQGHFL
ncbi:MAG: hypothetical protein Q8O99_07990 [bacterium]|nr:hypothetical protein [bacterium]